MARGCVLDSYALLAWLQGEAGASLVREMLISAGSGADETQLHMSVINAGEVYYRLFKTGRGADAVSFLGDLVAGRLPIRLQAATTDRVWKAAKLKAVFALSYADAFAVGLAQELAVELYTGDPEILALPPDVVSVRALPSR